MEELVRSPAVCLTIGPEQNQTTVQASLFRGISEPLNRLLSSIAAGHTDTTSINDLLRHDDKDASLQLVSVAYNTVLRGDSNNNAGQPRMTEAASLALVNPNSGGGTGSKSLVKCNQCKGPAFVEIICPGSHCIDTRYGGLQSFFNLGLTQSHGSISKQSGLKSLQTLDSIDKSTGRRHPLIHFAKVFHLTSKYEILSLQASALKAFERRLKKYSALELRDNDELLDVLRYLASTSASTWSSKESSEVGEPAAAASIGTGALLNSLMRYVVVHVEDLLEEDEFQEIVAEHGMIGLELMKVIKESIVASRGP